MTRVPDLEPEPMAPAISITIAILVAPIIAFFSWSFFSEGQPDWSPDERAQLESGIHFPPLEVIPQHLKRARQDHYDEPDLSSVAEEVERLRSFVQKANIAQFEELSQANAEAYQELDHGLRLMADEVLPATGVTGFQSLGEPIFESCNSGLNDLLESVQRGEITIAEASEDPPEHFSDYRENCGNLLPILLERRLVSPDGTWNHKFGSELVDIIQRYRWADLIHTRHPTSRQISPYELAIFYRWRIEDPEAFTIAERRRFIAEARRSFPVDYDVELAAARLDVADHDLDSAMQRMAALSLEHPDSTLYNALYDELQRQLEPSASR